MSAERFFDDLARTLAEPMPRRRAVRLIGASLATLAMPGISPAAGAVRPGRQGGLGATCPDGSECTGRGEKCCDRPNARGAYNCVPPGKMCCCGNALCDPVKQRCLCTPGGGSCAPKCELTYGRNWKDCGPNCCQPHERCVDPEKGKCISCEDEGKQTCRAYNEKTGVVICCPATRGSFSPCCASLTTAVCCGPKQQCKAQSAKKAACICKPGEGKKCGPDCCKKNETCCDRALCCAKGEICCDKECCDPGREVCYVDKGIKGCAPISKCKGNGVRCGVYCCGPETTCRTRQGRKVCV